MMHHNHICGLYFLNLTGIRSRQYLPQLSASAHTKIISSTSRTTLTQTFVNPKAESISELRYTFPLDNGVSVVGFVCTIDDDRVIRGVVKERAEAKKTYQEAVDRGETAGLLEQLPAASDVFTTTIGNVPANATLKIEITYLGELKHDAEVDGIRFTIPTNVAPRYGAYPGELLKTSAVKEEGISIVVDVEMPEGSNIKNVQSPSHPISVTLGNTSVGAASGADMSLQKASATLALATAELSGDFVLQVVATNTGNPIAVLETHPTIPNHRALMATLVPKFNLPSSRPEIVFVCDRSGSMSGSKMDNLKSALHIFLKSLPVGVKFNICSFGSHHEFLFPDGSQTYDASSLEKATKYVDTFSADFGGTEMYAPMEETFKKRYTDMDTEVFLLTDGEIWDQSRLFDLVNKNVADGKGNLRIFTLGIGRDASQALIEGVAAAGNGFSQSVGHNENMNSKVVRMLKASLTPHIKDYTLEIKYGNDGATSTDDSDDFEVIEKVIDALTIDVPEPEPEQAEAPKKPISLFDQSADPDTEMTDTSLDTTAGGKYSHVPPVPEPKFLQAPFKIPPLYPFNRTSVYLLLSSETVQKQPKSVVLRGTSPVGPVELEIPVTVIPEKGETIHQLAARKAVKELEEGRGWIYHAKDAKDGDKLLKDKYPGRFSDMVEREAVRLGVTYQVGGKWCSFVAVEENMETVQKKQPEHREERTGPLPTGSLLPRQQLASKAARKSAPSDTSSKRKRSSARPCSYSMAAPTPQQPLLPPQQQSAGFGSVRRGAPFATPPAPPPGSIPAPAPAINSFFSSAAPPAGRSINTRSRTAAAAQQMPVFSAALAAGGTYPLPSDEEDECEGFSLMDDSPAVSSSPLPPPPPPPALVQTLGFGGGGELRRQRAEQTISIPGVYPRSEPEPAKPKSVADLTAGERLNVIVGLQSFVGSWAWSEELVELLGLDKGVVVQKAAEGGLGGEGDEVLATGLVLAYLEGKLKAQEEEWEMLADKAREWLRGELGGVLGGKWTVEGYLEAVGKLL